MCKSLQMWFAGQTSRVTWHSVEIFEFAETLSMWVSVCELWHIKKTNKLRNKKKKTHKKVHFIHRPYRKINCIVCGDLLNAIEKWALAVKSRHWLEEAARDAGNKRDYVLWSTKTVKKKKSRSCFSLASSQRWQQIMFEWFPGETLWNEWA